MTPQLNKMNYADAQTDIKKIPKNSIAMVFTSPPYNVNINYGTHNDNLPLTQYIDYLHNIFIDCIKVLMPGGHLLIQIANTGHKPYTPVSSLLSVRLRNDIEMRSEIIWDKQNITHGTAWGSWLSPNMPSIRDRHEHILVFRKDGNRFGKSDITAEEFINSTESIWNVHAETRERWHPAPFSIKLAEKAIKLYTFIGETVLDPFAGSGTTGIACIKNKRNFICLDNNKEFVTKSRQRIARYTGDIIPTLSTTEYITDTEELFPNLLF